MVWRRHTWQMCAPWSCLSLAGGSCGRQTAGHSSCRAQGPRSIGGTWPCLARPHGTASPSTSGLHQSPEIHLRKNLKLIYLAASALEVISNWALYKLTHSLIHSFIPQNATSSSEAITIITFYIHKSSKNMLLSATFFNGSLPRRPDSVRR